MDRVKSGHNKENENDVLRHRHTPSRRRVALGTPANYYFKYMNSSKKSVGDNNESLMADEEGNTGTISIPGHALQGMGGNTDCETSYLSIAAASSSSSESGDLLNKSALSDTTELTASNFVLVTTSKQQMARTTMREATDRQRKAERALEILARRSPQKRNEVLKGKEDSLCEGSQTNNAENFLVNQESTVRMTTETRDGSSFDKANEYQPNTGKGTIGLRDSSPSLRSRFTASPSTMRQYSESLRNKRLQRQFEREEDEKRRTSTSSLNSIPYMRAQLEALTTENSYSRRRLPPPFTQLSQEVHECNSNASTPEGSLTPASNGDASFVNMDELDELLKTSSYNPGRRVHSSVTANRSSIERALGTKAQDLNFSDDGTKQASIQSDKKTLNTPPAIEVPIKPNLFQPLKNSEQEHIAESVARSMPTLALSPRPKVCLTPGSQPTLTPSQGSSKAKRVVDSQDNFSLTNTTRSVGKCTDYESEIDNLGGAFSIGAHCSTAHEAGGNESPSETRPVRFLERESITSRDSDQTASPGELEQLFGVEDANIASSLLNDSSVSYQQNDLGVDASVHVQTTSLKATGETASLEDIRYLFGQNTSESVGTPSSNNKSDLEHEIETKEEGIKILEPQSVRTVQNVKSPTLSAISSARSHASNAASTSWKHSSVDSAIENLPITPPHVDLSAMSPSVSRLLSGPQRAIPSAQSLCKRELYESSLSPGSKKKPMRLTPNAHVALTPSKLPPTPRRVLNPNNPDSPARNTRSASRKTGISLVGNDSPSGISENQSKRQHDEWTGPAQLFQDEGLAHSNKRRRSSFVSTLNSSRPIGIMSSRKKEFSSNRSVAFGSPQAAEYNVGSPSVSITPMPRGRVKALYRLPDSSKDHGYNDENERNKKQQRPTTKTPSDDNRKIESDMNVLVDRISADNMDGSPELSPIAKLICETGVFHNAKEPPKSKLLATEEISISKENTVELEPGMDGLLENVFNGALDVQAYSSPEMDGLGFENSIEMTDSESIASIHSRRSEKFTAEFPLKVQKLDFRIATESSPPSKNESDGYMDESETIELEDVMTTLLSANYTQSEELPNENHSAELPGAAMESTEFLIQSTKYETLSLVQGNVAIEDRLSTDLDENIGLVQSFRDALVEKQDGQTEELEANMSELLAFAGQQSTSQKAVRTEDPRLPSSADPFEGEESQTVVKPRASLASESFVLLQPDRFSVSMESVERQAIVVNEKSVSFCDTAEFILARVPSSPLDDEQDGKPELLSEKEATSLTNKLFRALNTTLSSIMLGSPDVLSRFAQVAGNHDTLVLDRLRQFLELVCQEVEKNTDPHGSALKLLTAHMEDEPMLYSELHKQIVDSHDGQNIYSLQPIFENGLQVINFEWNDWLNTVLQSLLVPLENIPTSLMDDSTTLDDALEACNQNQNEIAMVNHRRAHRARMKSLIRRRESVKTLEKEIELMKEQLTVTESEINVIRDQERHHELEKDSLDEICRLAATCNDVRSIAETSQKSYLSLRGVHSLSLGGTSDTNVNVVITGTCQQASPTLLYDWGNSKKITSQIVPQKTTSCLWRNRYRGPLCTYLNFCTGHWSQIVKKQRINDTTLIGLHAQKHAWLFGRLDFTAKELHSLQRRYGGKLVRKTQESFSLLVEFRGNSLCVEVEFPLDPYYPSFPVEVHLELVSGDLDLGEVRKNLIKQSKPGFGSLSRACDIVEAFILRKNDSVMNSTKTR